MTDLSYVVKMALRDPKSPMMNHPFIDEVNAMRKLHEERGTIAVGKSVAANKRGGLSFKGGR